MIFFEIGDYNVYLDVAEEKDCNGFQFPQGFVDYKRIVNHFVVI